MLSELVFFQEIEKQITTAQARFDRCFGRNISKCCGNPKNKEKILTLGNGKLRNFTEGFLEMASGMSLK